MIKAMPVGLDRHEFMCLSDEWIDRYLDRVEQVEYVGRAAGERWASFDTEGPGLLGDPVYRASRAIGTLFIRRVKLALPDVLHLYFGLFSWLCSVTLISA